MQLADLDLKERFSAKVVTSERITPADSEEEVRELVLDVQAPAPFAAGQSVGVVAPGDPQFGHHQHVRLYSVADLPTRGADGAARIKIAVKRCRYIDEYSGERYDGVASNYLCDLRPGAALTLTGPVGLPFAVPEEKDANLILIATSTGIAPFRAFVRHLYEKSDFMGRIMLFYGARSGLDVLYLNDEGSDFAQYYDMETFEAFQALSPRPHFGDDIAWDAMLLERAAKLSSWLDDPKTYVYVAGLAEVSQHLDRAFEQVTGGVVRWKRRKAELIAGRRWLELLY